MNYISLILPTATFTTQTDKEIKRLKSNKIGKTAALSLLSVKLAVLSTMRQLSLFIAYTMCLRDFRELHLLYIFVCIHYPGLRVLNYFSFTIFPSTCASRGVSEECSLSWSKSLSPSKKVVLFPLHLLRTIKNFFFLISYE